MKNNIGNYLRFILLSSMIAFMFTGCLSQFDVFESTDTLESVKDRIESGEDVNAQDALGKTLLFVAAEKGKIDIVEYLVANGADVNIEADDGYTPLIIASQNAHFEVIKHLVENGAKINHQMENNNYALYQLVGYEDQNSDKDYLEMVKYMVENGADYKLVGFNNYTLLHASRSVEIIEYLRKLGMDIHALTENNATSLVGSIANKGVGTEVTQYFIDNCVDLHKEANFGGKYATAYSMALKFNRFESADLIKVAMESPPKKCYAFKTIAPLVEFYNIARSSTDADASVYVKITAQESGIGMIKIFLNDTQFEDIDLFKRVDEEGLKTFRIKLNKISDSVKVHAYDSDSIIRSNAVFHTSEYVNEKEEPKLYAVVIGIDTFKAKELDLKYAQADSVLFGSTVFKRSRDLYSEANVIYLKKENETTKDAILDKLKELENISQDDVFVFYAATQATIANGKYHMLTSNVSSIDAAEVSKNGLSEDDLREAFKKIPAQKKLILFDTDYSDLANDNISIKVAKSSSRLLDMASISAVNSVHTSLNDYGNKHGVFAYVLSDALDGGADINSDGIVDSSELVEYAMKTIPVEAKEYNHIQNPISFQYGEIFNVSKVRDFKETPEVMEAIDTEVEEVVKAEPVVPAAVAPVLPVAPVVVPAPVLPVEKNVDLGEFKLKFKDDAIYLNIKDKVKADFYRVTDGGEHQIVFDFDSDSYVQHVLESVDTDKVSKVEIGFHQTFFRMVFYTKIREYYEYKETANGIEIILRNKE